MWRLRSFPEEKRNYYKISVTRSSKYLIRTVFLCGNYDGRNMSPQFDLLLGANLWATLTIKTTSITQNKEWKGGSMPTLLQGFLVGFFIIMLLSYAQPRSCWS